MSDINSLGPTSERRSTEEPFFSICVPQHNRTGLLIDALKQLEAQAFQSLEVCISEDCSTDGRQQELADYLAQSRLAHWYAPTDRNLRYDANLRRAMSMARGKYLILFGNDDCIRDGSTLQTIHDLLAAQENVGVLIGNFEDWSTGRVTRRIRADTMYDGVPLTGVMHFRNLAFVSGIVVQREAAQAIATERWDGSEMYQMYIFCRVMASGLRLLETTTSLVRKDMASTSDFVDSYAKRDRVWPCPLVERKPPFVRIGQVVADAISPHQRSERRNAERELIFRQLYCFTYPFWLFEYRRVQSWRFALGIALGIRPKNVLGELDVGWWRKQWLRLLWCTIAVFGLLVPISWFDKLRQVLYSLSRSFGARSR